MDSIDQLKIDTPEQIALELPLAGIGSRFLAIAIDTLIQTALYLIVGLIVILTLPVDSMFTFLPRLIGPALAVFLIFAIYWGYFAIFEALWKGQTPGKRFAGIRVIKESGRPINAFEAVGRNLMRAVDVLPVPRTPAKRYPCTRPPERTSLSSVWATTSCPTRSAKRWGR